MSSSATFTLTSQPYLDEYNKCYKNIITINTIPQGPLAKFVRNLKLPRLSPFQVEGPCNPIEKCTLAVTNFLPNININNRNCSHLLTPNEMPDLISFLLSNGYQIETQITKMMYQNENKLTNKNLSMIVTYYGNKQQSIVYMR